MVGGVSERSSMRCNGSFVSPSISSPLSPLICLHAHPISLNSFQQFALPTSWSNTNYLTIDAYWCVIISGTSSQVGVFAFLATLAASLRPDKVESINQRSHRRSEGSRCRATARFLSIRAPEMIYMNFYSGFTCPRGFLSFQSPRGASIAHTISPKEQSEWVYDFNSPLEQTTLPKVWLTELSLAAAATCTRVYGQLKLGAGSIQMASVS